MESGGSTIRYVSPIVVLLGTALTGAGLTGCSFIGYAIGSRIDSGEPIDTAQSFLQSDLARIAKGDSLGLDLVDGGYVAGTFKSISLEDSSAYHQRCLRRRERAGLPKGIPLPGDSIFIIGHTGKDPIRLIGTLASYDSASLWTYRVHGGTWPTPYSVIDTLFFGKEGIVPGKWLREAASSGGLPLLGRDLVLESWGLDKRVPLDRVAAFHIRGKGSAKWTGLGIGIAVDVVVVVAAVLASGNALPGAGFK